MHKLILSKGIASKTFDKLDKRNARAKAHGPSLLQRTLFCRHNPNTLCIRLGEELWCSNMLQWGGSIWPIFARGFNFQLSAVLLRLASRNTTSVTRSTQKARHGLCRNFSALTRVRHTVTSKIKIKQKRGKGPGGIASHPSYSKTEN